MSDASGSTGGMESGMFGLAATKRRFERNLPDLNVQVLMPHAPDDIDDYKKNANAYFHLIGLNILADLSLVYQLREICEHYCFGLELTIPQTACNLRAIERMCAHNQPFSAIRFCIKLVCDNNRRLQASEDSVQLHCHQKFLGTTLLSSAGPILLDTCIASSAAIPETISPAQPIPTEQEWNERTPSPPVDLATPRYTKAVNDTRAIGKEARAARKQPYPKKSWTSQESQRGRYFREIKPLLDEHKRVNGKPERNQEPLPSFVETPSQGEETEGPKRRRIRPTRVGVQPTAVNPSTTPSDAYAGISDEECCKILSSGPECMVDT